MVLGKDIEKFIASFLTLHEIKNLSFTAKNWRHLHSIFVATVLDFMLPVDIDIVYGPMPDRSQRAPYTVYVDFRSKRDRSKSVTCITDLPPIHGGGLVSTDEEALRTEIPPNDDYAQLINARVYPANNSTYFNDIPLTERYCFSFANTLHLLTSHLPLHAPKMQYLALYLGYRNGYLVKACYANPELAHSVMSNAYLRSNVPQIEQHSAHKNKFFINHLPRQNLILTTYAFLFLAFNGLYQFSQHERIKSDYRNDLIIAFLILLSLKLIEKTMSFLQDPRYFHSTIINGPESWWRQRLAKIPDLMQRFPNIEYIHERKTISLQQIADEYEQGISSEDKNQLFAQERAAFRILLEKEQTALTDNKGCMHRLFKRLRNPEKDAVRLGHINTALEKLSELKSHEEFIVFKARLLDTEDLRGSAKCGLDNDGFYNKMLSF